MNVLAQSPVSADIPLLLRGDTAALSRWLDEASPARLFRWVAVICLGSALYGGAMGLWRSELQALYTALKFPLILGLTTIGNALLNGMLAPLLGMNLRFRESLLAILMSFTIAAAILGAFSPLLVFLLWNVPPLTPGVQIPEHTYRSIQLLQVGAIAFAGVAANVRLVQLLEFRSRCAPAARRVLFAWLAGNLFLGSQLVWILRPLIGSPHLPVQFLRPDAFRGSFYETVFQAIRHLISG